ncbi:MAG: cob(I)yrinic acid a,c-diamide adenosyltransferase [Ruminococcus sp.]|nr:cob(I)yrinic acid a,c-diamide adenosyltransferase [Ruminococcus sp.]
MIHIYCGDGKGKTTAAAGLAVRCAGAGLKAAFFQFLKDGTSSEIGPLRKLGIRVRCCKECSKFVFEMSPEEKSAAALAQDSMLREAESLLREGFDMIVLDEFFGALTTGTLTYEAAKRFVEDFPVSAELVLTGRDPDRFFLDKADYISQIHALAHPYDKGVPARRGIEF